MNLEETGCEVVDWRGVCECDNYYSSPARKLSSFEGRSYTMQLVEC
jgi:hypothetical protein